eukprot:8804812-Ditylum_brightwellii.AAC.1
MQTITAVKIDSIYAKLFIGLLGNGHCDGIPTTFVICISLAPYVSGSADGEVCVWYLTIWSEVGHISGAHMQMVMVMG